MVNREVNLPKLMDKSSYFLLGPRGTGKSFLIRKELSGPEAVVIDLLDSRSYLRLQNSPHELAPMATKPIVVIDEIQRIPELLNEVHRLIEEKQLRFLLTGSSARKLRRSGTNLLAGRAFKAQMFPLTWRELARESRFNLERFLLLGGLPHAYLQDIGQEYLYNYVDVYLKEEIQTEALVRNLANYSRFLENAALSSGQILNFAKVAADAQLSPNTVRDYYQILEDTLLGYPLLPWRKTTRRKAVSTAKFYFFDIGVLNALRNVSQLPPAGDLVGQAFEHFIGQELRAYLSYHQRRETLCFWRAKSQHEVDFIIGDETAIEVKAARKVSPRDHHGLKALAEEKPWRRMLVVSMDPQTMVHANGIEHLFWEDFLDQLWRDQIVSP
jgi:predicted AAA+ superfamily ATPase